MALLPPGDPGGLGGSVGGVGGSGEGAWAPDRAGRFALGLGAGGSFSTSFASRYEAFSKSYLDLGDLRPES